MRSLVLALALVACKSSQFPDSSKVDIAKKTTKMLAYEAYPQWAQTHPSKACPDSIDDLAVYTNEKSVKDPWGNPYKILCGSTLPAGAKGLVAVSAGEDGKDGTADDVSSDKN